MFSRLEFERSVIPWTAANRALTYIGEMMKRSPDHDHYLKFMRRLLRGAYSAATDCAARTGAMEELAEELHHLACEEIEMDECARVTIRDVLSDDADRTHYHNKCLRQNQRASYCSLVANGGRDEWDAVYEKFVESDGQTHRGGLLGALACTRDPHMMEK